MRKFIGRMRTLARGSPAAPWAGGGDRGKLLGKDGWRAGAGWSALALAILSLAILSVVAVCGKTDERPHPPANAHPPRRVPVHVAPVVRVEEISELRFPGTTRATRRAQLSFMVGGRLSDRTVNTGDRVEQGAAMARLDSEPFRNSLRAAEASLAEAGARLQLAEAERRRVLQLYEGGIVTRQHLEGATAAEEQLRAALALARSGAQEARRRLAEATLTAPFTGTIVAVHFEPGEYVEAGMPVATLWGDVGLEIEIEVFESVASAFEVGTEVSVEFPLARIGPAPGRLKSVARAAAGSGQLFPVVAELESAPGILPGMAGELVLRRGNGMRLAVPLSAVIDPSGKQPCVFRVRNGHAQRVPIAVGMLVGNQVTVTAELEEGDLLVVAGHAVLLDGDPVEAQ